MAEKRPRVSRSEPLSRPVHDCFFCCPGSGVIHGQLYVQVMRGPKATFIRCPKVDCGVMIFFRGDKWDETAGVFASRQDIAAMNPGAMIC